MFRFIAVGNGAFPINLTGKIIVGAAACPCPLKVNAMQAVSIHEVFSLQIRKFNPTA